MSSPLQLRIPTPCHENWESMHPNEQGRHCMACQKTVVDFTLMSDTEIIHYFSKASGSVCGRVGSDQLNRKLEVPRPPRKSPWMGWPVLLSGLLFTSDEVGSHRVAGKTELHQCERSKVEGLENVTVGAMLMMPDTSVVEQVGERHDTVEVIKMGEMMGDVVLEVEPPVKDTVLIDKRQEEPDSEIYTGGIVVTEHPDNTDSVEARKAVTRWHRNVFDTVKQIVMDSLAVVGIKVREDSAGVREEIPSEPPALKSEPPELTVYPNPVLKGANLNLSWKKEAVDGRVNLYNMGGALIQSWMIQGGSTLRTLTMPADIAAGVYVLQVSTKEGVCTRKVVVE